MIKSVRSPRKVLPKGSVSPRVASTTADGKEIKKSPSGTPKTPRKLEASSKQSLTKRAMTEITDKVEVLELQSKLVPGSTNINLKNPSFGDRIRNGGGGDSCMRLPLDCMSKEEIKDEMKDSTLPFHQLGYQDDNDILENEEEPEEEYDDEKMTTILGPDRARFNIWKGTNYDLHLLGDFKSDFERRVKSFQKPETESISMDPFCRSESGLKDEPCRGDAFLVWKNNKSFNEWHQHCSNSQHDVTTATLMSSDEEDDIDGFNSDTDSLPDPEMMEYLLSQKKKLKEGTSPTGETLYYDEEFGVVRNLHRDSHSLTNYGAMQADDTWIGKANIFYPEMSAEEKKMLKAVVSRDEIVYKNSNINASPRLAV